MKPFRLLISLALACLIGLGAAAPLAAQSDDDGGPQVNVLSVDNSVFPLLTLKLSVVNTTGQPVRGLTTAAIAVKEDQTDAEVLSVKDIEDTQLGIGVVLVIDVSGSMAGDPIAAARQAAATFVDSLGPTDQVAILAFDRQVTPLLSFGAKKEDAQYVIKNLSHTPGGATALYDAAKQGVLTASTSSLPRRMVILLSDGKEYPGASLSGREDAYKEATAKGVTIHTLGLGTQIDEGYLQQLSGLTGGVYLAAPSPAQLQTRWQEIATLMRQLVEVQVKSHLSGEGKRHDLTVSVKIGNQTVEARNSFFSKAVAPQVIVADLPQAAIETETTVTAHVEAPTVLRVAFNVDGKLLVEDASPPWEAKLDPLKLAPGKHRLEIVATEAGGLTGSGAADFQVAALPPKIELTLAEGQLVDQPLSVTPAITAQGDIKEVALAIDGGQAQPLAAPAYRFELDPAKLKSGVHKLTLTVTDVNAQTTSKEIGFSVPAAAPSAAAPIIVVPPSGGGGINPVLIGVIIFAIVVLAGIVGFVLMRRAPARAIKTSGPQLKILSGLEKGQTFPITPTPQIIGRLSSAPIRLSDPTGALRVSREHAKVWLEEGAAWIEDANSRHGTYVDGSRLVTRFRLVNGARIKIGEVELVAQGITVAAEDLRATSFAPLDKTQAGAAVDASTRQTQVTDEAEGRVTKTKSVEADAETERQTHLKPSTAETEPVDLPTLLSPAEAEAELGRVTAKSQGVSEPEAEERQTRLKPAEGDTLEAEPDAQPAPATPPSDTDADSEAARATKIRREAELEIEERLTRLKPTQPAAPEAEPDRQPAPATLSTQADVGATRIAKPRAMDNAGETEKERRTQLKPGVDKSPEEEARLTKLKPD